MHEHPLSDTKPKKSLSEVKIHGDWKTYGLMSKNFNTPYPKGEYIGTSKEIRIDGIDYHEFVLNRFRFKLTRKLC